MSLRTVTGAPRDLDRWMANRLADLRSQSPLDPVTVLVGTSLQRPHLGRWLAGQLGAHANLRVLMPSELALLLGAPALLAAGRRALPPLADRILLTDVARSQDGYFSVVADTPGLGEALYQLVRELKGAGYELGDLAPLLSGTTDAPEKAGALAAILREFERRRTEFYGPDDALLAADAARLDGLGLVVTGMLDIPPALERLLRDVAQHMPVDILLPEAPAATDTPTAELRTRLIAAGASHEPLAPSPTVASPLGTVRSLFTQPTGETRPAEPDTTRLVSAPDPSREVRAAARAFIAWAHEGVPFWDMALAYRHGDAYRPLVEAIFAEAQVPVYLHEGSPLSERPVGRQTLALLALFDSDLSRRSVMDFLTDARLPSELHDAHGGIAAARWDSVSRQAGIVAGATQWAERLGALIADLTGGEDPEVADWAQARANDAAALASFIADLADRLANHPGVAPWAEHLDYLHTLTHRYVRNAEQILDALRGLERFTALEAEVSFDRFLDVVRRAIETLRSEEVVDASAGAFHARGVNVVATNSLRGLRFSRVWILGATERSFPPPARQDPILLDDEREAISARADAPLAPRGRRGNEEALGFALACEAATDSLVVSYARRAMGESRPRLPSTFFREVASQLEGRRISAEEAPLLARADVERIPGDAIGVPIPAPGPQNADPQAIDRITASAISQAERDRTFLQATATRPFAIATLEHTAPAFARARAARQARFATHSTVWDGALDYAGAQAVQALIGSDYIYSASKLENYAACPQRFFLSSVLGLREVSEPERTVRIDAIHRGNLFHRIFERFHDEWEGPWPAERDSGAPDRLRTIADEECRAAEQRGETGYPAMWHADRQDVIEDCQRWLDSERASGLLEQYAAGACEARFGPRFAGEKAGALGRDEPIRIPLPQGREDLKLSGRIDRLIWDERKTRFRVVDYKTGKVRDERAGQLQGGRMLQLPLYAFAGAELLGIDVTAGEAAYSYATRRGEFRSVEWERQHLAARREDVIALLASMVDAMGRGDFMVAPYDPTFACRFCEFDGICPSPRRAYVDRKADDERFQQLEEEIRSVE